MSTRRRRRRATRFCERRSSLSISLLSPLAGRGRIVEACCDDPGEGHQHARTKPEEDRHCPSSPPHFHRRRTEALVSSSFKTALWLQFVRQEPIGQYVADFVCRERRLIVEVDGGQHATDPRDMVRDAFLTRQGYRMLRFWNNDVLANTSGVLETIADALAAPLPLTRIAARSDLSPQAGRGDLLDLSGRFGGAAGAGQGSCAPTSQKNLAVPWNQFGGAGLMVQTGLPAPNAPLLR